MQSKHSKYYCLGGEDLGDYNEAIIYFDKALAIDPKYEPAYINKGLALYGLGKYNEAINSYEKALTINPNDGAALINIGSALVKLGQYDKARDFFKKAAREHTQPTEPKVITRSYDVSKDYFTILDVACISSNQQDNDDQTKVDNQTKVSWINNGITYKLDQNYLFAVIWFKKVLTNDPKYFFALWNMADTMRLEHNDTWAKIYYVQAVNSNPNSHYQGTIITYIPPQAKLECNGLFTCGPLPNFNIKP